MKVMWIVIFVVLFVFNFFYLIYDCMVPFFKELKKKNKDGYSHDKCVYLDAKNNCSFCIARQWRKIKKNTSSVCPGAKGCFFFLSGDVNTGEIKRANIFFLTLNSLFSHIPALTALIVTFYEIISMF